jgi:hypothetical protein
MNPGCAATNGTETRSKPVCPPWMAILGILGLVACSGPAPVPQSTASLYPDRPVEGVKVEGSRKQAVIYRSMPATFDEVFDASTKAAFQKGLEIDFKDRKRGRLSGKGSWQLICGAGPCTMQMAFAVYIQEIDSTPTTKITLYVDRISFTGSGGGEATAANNLIIEIQKIISAQR